MKPVSSGYADVNGISLYHEICVDLSTYRRSLGGLFTGSEGRMSALRTLLRPAFRR